MLKPCGTLLVLLALIYISAASEEPVVASRSVNISPTSLIIIGDTMFYIEDKIPRNWFAARKACESMGYNLLSLDTTAKLNAINSYLDNRNDTWYYWTSGNDFLTLGRHVWFPSGKPVASNLWHSGQPDNKNDVKHCDQFGLTGTRLMTNEDCTFTRYSICERALN